MKHLAKRSDGQLALCLERKSRHELTPDQEAALLLALSDLLLEALGETPPAAASNSGESHER
jgi:hypothetical protein